MLAKLRGCEMTITKRESKSEIVCSNCGKLYVPDPKISLDLCTLCGKNFTHRFIKTLYGVKFDRKGGDIKKTAETIQKIASVDVNDQSSFLQVSKNIKSIYRLYTNEIKNAEPKYKKSIDNLFDVLFHFFVYDSLNTRIMELSKEKDYEGAAKLIHLLGYYIKNFIPYFYDDDTKTLDAIYSYIEILLNAERFEEAFRMYFEFHQRFLELGYDTDKLEDMFLRIYGSYHNRLNQSELLIVEYDKELRKIKTVYPQKLVKFIEELEQHKQIEKLQIKSIKKPLDTLKHLHKKLNDRELSKLVSLLIKGYNSNPEIVYLQIRKILECLFIHQIPKILNCRIEDSSSLDSAIARLRGSLPKNQLYFANSLRIGINLTQHYQKPESIGVPQDALIIMLNSILDWYTKKLIK